MVFATSVPNLSICSTVRGVTVAAAWAAATVEATIACGSVTSSTSRFTPLNIVADVNRFNLFYGSEKLPRDGACWSRLPAADLPGPS